MRRNNGGFINTAPHGSITWGDPAIDAGRWCGSRGEGGGGGGGGYHICCVLPQDYEVGGVPSVKVSYNGSQRRKDEGTFHVHTFTLEGCSAAGREWTSAPMQHVQNSHVGGSSD